LKNVRHKQRKKSKSEGEEEEGEKKLAESISMDDLQSRMPIL